MLGYVLLALLMLPGIVGQCVLYWLIARAAVGLLRRWWR